MQKVRVQAQNGAYDILLGQGLLEKTQQFIQKGRRHFIISDSNVYPLYGEYFSGYPSFIIRAGEESKSHESLLKIYDELAKQNITREDVVVALGGGVVGDLAGFAAATFKRGVRFVQVPTTLLAQVDSSVGGKVGVNLKSGKNMVGSFYQPSFVLADTNVFQTLPGREFAAGMAEVIKYAFIADQNLYSMLDSKNTDLAEIIRICCAIKAGYVQRDPFDQNVRMELNFGHTLGHAIETATRYKTYLHGEAVAVGMVLAARVGERAGVSEAGLEQMVKNLLLKNGLPVSVEDGILQAAVDNLMQDKKAAGNSIHFVLIDQIGHAIIRDFTLSELEELVL
jgi:3-dehydroquinate synthase